MARGLTVLLLTYVAATPSLLLGEVFATRPFVHAFSGYGKAVFLTTLLCTLSVYWRRAVSGPALATVSLLLAAAAVYMLLDVVHAGAPLGVLQLGKDLFYNKVTSSYLVAAVLFGLFVLIETKSRRPEIVRTTTITLSVFAGMSLALWLLIEGGGVVFGDHSVTNNNFQAHESACVLFVFLFLAQRQFRGFEGAAVVAVNGVVPIVHQSRGAIVVALSVVTAYLVMHRASVGWSDLFRGPVAKTVVVIWIGLALALSGVTNAEPKPRLSEWTSASSRLFHTLRSGQMRDTPDSNREISSSDNVVSAYSRLGTTVLAAKAFLSSPLIGIGISNAYQKIEVAGFGIHGLLPLVAAAYGVLGLLPMLAVVGVFLTNNPTHTLISRYAIGLFLLVAMFVNAYPPWLGLLLWSTLRATDETSIPSPLAHRVGIEECPLPG